MSARRRTAGPSLAFRLFASLLVFVLVATGAELGARWLNPVLPVWQPADPNSVVMVGHPTRLWGMGTGVRNNAGTTCFINDKGLRGVLPELPRPPGRQRVMVLGDSTFFGHGVADDQTMSAQVQALLQARGMDVDSVNAAVPGYSTEQSLILLDEDGWDLQPTLLLIGNLWSDNNVDGFKDADLLRTVQAFHDNPLADSAFYRLLAGFIDHLRGRDTGRIVTWTRTSEWPKDGSRRVPLQRYAANLDRIVREAAQRGVGAAFVAPANHGMVTDQFPSGAGWDPYFRAQAAVAAWHGLPVIDGLAALKGVAAQVGPDAVFVDEMHPTAVGQAGLAQATVDTLLAASWPEEAPLGRSEPFDASELRDDPLLSGPVAEPGRSPQAQLFASTTPTLLTPPMANAVPTPGEAVHPGGPGAGSHSWPLQGSVLGGVGPMKVEVRGLDGAPLGFARMAAPGEFSLSVRQDQAEVEVVVTDAQGATATVHATARGDPVHLSLQGG